MKVQYLENSNTNQMQQSQLKVVCVFVKHFLVSKQMLGYFGYVVYSKFDFIIDLYSISVVFLLIS